MISGNYYIKIIYIKQYINNIRATVTKSSCYSGRIICYYESIKQVKSMAEDGKPSQFSSTFLSGLSQACAFTAAPLLTAGAGMVISHMLGMGSWITLAAPYMVGILAIGAAFAGAAIVANFKANKQRSFEQSNEIEHCVAHAIGHQADLSMGQVAEPQREKCWAQHVTENRQINAELSR